MRYALSPEPERAATPAKIPLRSGIAGLGHLHAAQRRKRQGEQKEEEEVAEGGSPNIAHPTRHSGRKQSSVGTVSAQETSRRKG